MFYLINVFDSVMCQLFREDYERLIKNQTMSVEETEHRLRLISEERDSERKLSAQNVIYLTYLYNMLQMCGSV